LSYWPIQKTNKREVKQPTYRIVSKLLFNNF